MSVKKGQLQRIVDAMWPSQDNSSSIDLIRDYAEKRDKNRGYLEIFRAYSARKLSVQAHFAYALTLKPTLYRTHSLLHACFISSESRNARESLPELTRTLCESPHILNEPIGMS